MKLNLASMMFLPPRRNTDTAQVAAAKPRPNGGMNMSRSLTCSCFSSKAMKRFKPPKKNKKHQKTWPNIPLVQITYFQKAASSVSVVSVSGCKPISSRFANSSSVTSSCSTISSAVKGASRGDFAVCRKLNAEDKHDWILPSHWWQRAPSTCRSMMLLSNRSECVNTSKK